MTRKAEARGIRNNNPGNIRTTSDAWVGLADSQTDSAFFVFTGPEYGIRALAKILHKYFYDYGLNTVSAMIARYSPAFENETGKYAAFVAARVGVDPDTPFQLTTETMTAMVNAMIKYENGYNPYPAETVSAGLAMANSFYA